MARDGAELVAGGGWVVGCGWVVGGWWVGGGDGPRRLYNDGEVYVRDVLSCARCVRDAHLDTEVICRCHAVTDKANVGSSQE